MRYAKTMSEALAEIREGFSKKEIKMAIGVASDPRYKQGNYTGAVNAIEKIKKGLSKHPQVAAVLKRQNEKLDQEDEPFVKDLIKNLRKGSETHGKQADDLEKAVKEETELDEGAMKNVVTDVEDAMGPTKIRYKLKQKGGKFVVSVDSNDEEDAQKALKKHPLYVAGKLRVIPEEVELDEVTMSKALDIDPKDADRMKTLAVLYTRAMKLPAGSPKQDKFKKEIERLRKELGMNESTFKELVKSIELDEKVEYVEYKFKNKNDAMAAKKMLDGIQLMSFDINDDNISGGELAVDAGSKDMTKYHKEIMKKFRPKVVTQETIDEGTWAVPETPAQKRDLKKLLSKPLPLGKEGDNAADKMYSIIGDDELFDDFYSAGKEDPKGDARPLIKKAMKRLKIKEDRWFDRDSWKLEESTKPDHIKVFNSLKKGDKVEINYDSSIAGGSTKTFVIKTKNKVYKGKVDKVTMYPDGKTGGVKFHLYQYDNRPGVYMAIGDMGASMRDIKKI